MIGRPITRVFDDADALAQVAADDFVHEGRDAILARGRFVVALSGGSTPRKLHALLAAHPYRDYIEWERVFILFGDERFVPPSDASSNERMARETLIDLVPVPPGQVYGMYHEGSPEGAAERYENIVRNLLGEELAIDLTLLGLGPDGHTASLFPGRPTVRITDRLVVAAQANVGVGDRISMTAPLINRSREIHFLVAGPDKSEPLRRVLEGDENLDETPAQVVVRYAANVKIYADKAAASSLSIPPM